MLATVLSHPPTSLKTEPNQIFPRAFWRRPSSEDKIIQAERREWADPTGFSRWQWSLVVVASPKLPHYLRQKNAFGVTPSPAPPPPDPATPAWFHFTPESVDAYPSCAVSCHTFLVRLATPCTAPITVSGSVPAPRNRSRPLPLQLLVAAAFPLCLRRSLILKPQVAS